MISPMTISVAATGFVIPSLMTAAASGTRARNFSIRESNVVAHKVKIQSLIYIRIKIDAVWCEHPELKVCVY